ncbi:hypothetical protein RJ639_020218 [Escallonia herrerae]|uniref:Fatty acyl-CoA reductase n=1 Tax=Escallonia herrerae TaxID=1293975 RepID=A0AA88V9M6_9ASTE|nr:hypothetical protein RJ639_020218 [Escallonia herrerae]
MVEVPVDMVVNATLAAIAKHGAVGNPELNVYQIASSIVNPLVIQDLTNMVNEHFSSSPWSDSNGRQICVSKFRHFTSMEEFSSHLREMAIRRFGLMPKANSNRITSQRMETLCRKSVELGVYLAKIYEAYAFYAGSKGIVPSEWIAFFKEPDISRHVDVFVLKIKDPLLHRINQEWAGDPLSEFMNEQL